MTEQTRVYDPDLRALAAAFKGLQTHATGNRPATFEHCEADPRNGVTQPAWAFMLQHPDEFAAQGFDALPRELVEPLTDTERKTFSEGFALLMRQRRKGRKA